MQVKSHPHSMVNWQRTSNFTDHSDSYFLCHKQEINATANSFSSTEKEWPTKGTKCLTGIAWSWPESGHNLCYWALAHVWLHHLVQQKLCPSSPLLHISYIYRDLNSVLSENCSLPGFYAACSGNSRLKSCNVLSGQNFRFKKCQGSSKERENQSLQLHILTLPELKPLHDHFAPKLCWSDRDMTHSPY
jgi:hypothetical protein